MSAAKTITTYVLFFILAYILSTGVFWLTYSGTLFGEMFYGVGDVERMAAIITEMMVYQRVAWPALIVLLYLVHYFASKIFNFAFETTVVVGFLYITSVLPDGFGENWRLLAGYMMAMVVFIFFGISFPKYTIRILKRKNMPAEIA